MYGANLSWKPLKRILDNFRANGLIREIPYAPKDKRTQTILELTNKGEKALNSFQQSYKDLGEIARLVT